MLCLLHCFGTHSHITEMQSVLMAICTFIFHAKTSPDIIPCATHGRQPKADVVFKKLYRPVPQPFESVLLFQKMLRLAQVNLVQDCFIGFA